jgi:hypothetical protein
VVSLVSPCVLRFSASPSSPPLSLWLEPRSLLVFEGEAFEGLEHWIEERDDDEWEGEGAYLNGKLLSAETRGLPVGTRIPRERRVSLTLRRAASVSRVVEPGEVLPPAVEEERRRREGWWRGAIGDGRAGEEEPA